MTYEEAQSAVFRFEYVPGIDEDFLEVVRVLQAAFPDTAFRLVQVLREERPVVMGVACKGTRVKLWSGFGRDKLGRKGARGTFASIAWPAKGESPDAFVHNACEELGRQSVGVAEVHGSENSLMRKMAQYYDAERDRMRVIRGKRERMLKRGPKRGRILQEFTKQQLLGTRLPDRRPSSSSSTGSASSAGSTGDTVRSASPSDPKVDGVSRDAIESTQRVDPVLYGFATGWRHRPWEQ